MRRWTDALRASLYSGAAASLASSVALVALGRRELRDGAAPMNGPSQWVWGTRAPCAPGFSVRHTVVGYAVHHLAATFWALLYEKWRPLRPTLLAAAATAAVANVVDFRLVPERLTPGFEKRLSRRAIAVAYVAFALGLLAASATVDERKPRASP